MIKRSCLGRTHKNKKDNQTWPSDWFSSCPKFRELSKKDKADLLEKHKSCARWLSWTHAKDLEDCKAPKSSCTHEGSCVQSSDQSVIDADVNQESIMQGRVFWDTGFSRVLIRNEFARGMNFRSQEMSYPLTVVGVSEVIYEMEILDNHGIVHKTRQGFLEWINHRRARVSRFEACEKALPTCSWGIVWAPAC